jgi:hypothetical protein
MSESLTNTGYYWPPRFTCPACLHDIRTDFTGPYECLECGAVLELSREKVPAYTAVLIDYAPAAKAKAS